MTENTINDLMIDVMLKEKSGIEDLISKSKGQYDVIVNKILNSKGRVIFLGVGKSGLIGKKLAATFSSTGTPSFFVHGTEAIHGDLGMITKEDIVIMISNSGNTKEVVQNIDYLERIGSYNIAFTSNVNSELAKRCDNAIIFPKLDEADHLNLAPSTSSTLTLVLGDAIAITLSRLKEFTKNDFHKYHPGGSLGKELSEGKDE